MPGIRSKIIIDEQARSVLPLLNLDSKENQPSAPRMESGHERHQEDRDAWRLWSSGLTSC